MHVHIFVSLYIYVCMHVTGKKVMYVWMYACIVCMYVSL